jgi:hypothetical protein
MTQLPEIARLMLERTPPAGPHPEPGLLTAFLEQTLAGRQRAGVLEHLSTCAECREVVALTMPEAVAATTPAAVPKRAAGKLWSPWRWAVAATAMVVLSAVWIDRWEPSSSPSSVSQVSQQRAAVSVENEPFSVAADGPGEQTPAAAAARPSPITPKAVLDAQVISAPGSKTPATAAQSPASDASVLSLAAAARNRRTSEQEAVPSAPVVAERKAAPATGPRVNALWETGMVAPAPNRVGTQPALWRVSAAGALERSLDSGHSWQQLPLAGNGVRLTVIHTLGRAVWVGASRGVLYRSLDSGRSWSRVVLSSGDMQSAGDVVSIQFSDEQHGSVLAGTGTRWVTADGGRSWRPLP